METWGKPIEADESEMAQREKYAKLGLLNTMNELKEAVVQLVKQKENLDAYLAEKVKHKVEELEALSDKLRGEINEAENAKIAAKEELLKAQNEAERLSAVSAAVDQKRQELDKEKSSHALIVRSFDEKCVAQLAEIASALAVAKEKEAAAIERYAEAHRFANECNEGGLKLQLALSEAEKQSDELKKKEEELSIAIQANNQSRLKFEEAQKEYEAEKERLAQQIIEYEAKVDVINSAKEDLNIVSIDLKALKIKVEKSIETERALKADNEALLAKLESIRQDINQKQGDLK